MYLVVLAGSASAQTANVSYEPTVTGYLNEVNRVEAWSYFQPREGGGDPTYSLFANRVTLGARVTSRHFDVDGAFQYAQLLGLSETQLGPGALGSGGFYFFSAEAPAAYQLYFKTMNVRVKDASHGVSITAGRMGYSSGEESTSGVPAIDDLTQQRVGSRMIGDFEWSVFQRSYDGLRMDVDRHKWAANLSLLFPTQGGYEESANPTMSSVKVWAGSVRLKPPLLPNRDVQVFAYHYRDHRDVRARPDNVVLGSRSVDVSIATIGASSVGTFSTEQGDVDTVFWAAGQTGTWYGQPHRAFSAALEAGYRLRTLSRPWFRAGFLHASGDRDGSDARHGTFFQMLPSIHRYSASTTYALMNLRDLFVQFSFEPRERLSARGEVHRLWLAHLADRWYYGSGATSRSEPFFGFAVRPSAGATSLGTLAESTIDLSLRREWSISAYLGWMQGGEVVRRQFAGERLVFFSLENTLRF